MTASQSGNSSYAAALGDPYRHGFPGLADPYSIKHLGQLWRGDSNHHTELLRLGQQRVVERTDHRARSTTYISTSTIGSYPTTCTGAVAANYSISYVAGANTVINADFTIASSGSTDQTILPGGSATFTYSFTPASGSTLSVPATLTVTGLPSGATATLTGTGWTQLTGTSWQHPANTAPGTMALTITAPSATANLRNDSGFGHGMAPLALGLLLLPLAGRLRRAGKRLNRCAMLLLLAVGASPQLY